MTDEQYPRSVDDDADPEALAAVQRALADLTFLRPDAEDGIAATPMPDGVWERISAALAAEGAPAATSRPAGSSRLLRWGGGLAAASVAVVAVGVGVTAFQGSGAIVAGDAPVATAAAELAPLAETAPEADSADGVEAADEAAPAALAAPRQFSFAGMVPPALSLVDSRTDYQPAALQGQVTRLLERVGFTPKQAMPTPSEAMDLPEDVPATGFTSSPRSLRDCITKLTEQEDSTALMVDRSTFEGQDAGIVVAPDYDVPAAQEPDMSMIEVWVVDPDCDVTMKIRFRMGR